MKRQVLILLSLAGLFLSHAAAAQDPVTIALYGALSADDNPVRDTPCMIEFALTDASNHVLFQKDFAVKTDGEGFFKFSAVSIPGSSAIEQRNETLTITMVLNAPGVWRSGDSFDVAYTLERDESGNYSMVRIDSQQLNSGSEDAVWLFFDDYPDSYISSTFMISFSKELTNPDDITNICLEMEEWPEAPEKDRGYKGGYAVGGYKTAK